MGIVDACCSGVTAKPKNEHLIWFIAWSTNTFSQATVEARLLETGNLVLINQANEIIWESFRFPTDTLLPTQPLVKNTTLVSMRNRGLFTSSDSFSFIASDYGDGPRRRLTIDYDGMLRLYSLDESSGLWQISWSPAGVDSCQVHGLCEPYGVCVYDPLPTCSCPYGFDRNDPSDWSKGCSPRFNLTCNPLELDFIDLLHTDYYYGYDFSYGKGMTLEACRNTCLNDCGCKGFAYSLNGEGNCYQKSVLLNGYRMTSFPNTVYIKVPRGMVIPQADIGQLRTNQLINKSEAVLTVIAQPQKLCLVVIIGGKKIRIKAGTCST
ncbi:hypothetical protein RJ639_024486 [Escallonia herrerae]|uniref:non-specific serine/threonine protein kinase n=1 Tax=Escallonia herrerae TaxID=1293975 RepID=A0AA88UZX7_9ASTE|nr:hypothetical protein RJ639_024486 [Escallonia herrerae]